MRAPEAVWPMTYAADRRKHRHRCGCGCNTIVQPGARVLMARVGPKKTRVMIDAPDHAGKVCDGYTMGDRLEAWGMEYLAACGWASAKGVARRCAHLSGGVVTRARTIRARKAHRAASGPHLAVLAVIGFGYLSLASLVALCALCVAHG